jgi:hypothetical protein
MEPSLPSPDLLGLSPASPFGELNPLVLSNDTGTTPRRSPGSSQSSIEAESLPTNSGAIVPPVIGTGNGLLGQYYSGINFDTLQLTRTDPTINFNFGFGSPGGAIEATRYSIRWTGKIQPEYSETYTFYTNSDDGMRLWVNGQQLINNWTFHNNTEDSNTITLVAGQTYDIKLDYFQGTGSAISQLSWSSLSQKKEIIPQSQLYEPDVMQPTANLLSPISTITKGSTANYQFSVIYDDKTGVRRSTIDNQDILVSSPNNFSQLAKLVSVSSNQDGTPLTATYSIEAPVGGWNANSSGIYSITLQANQVSDIDSNFISSSVLGTFLVDFVAPTAKLEIQNPVVGGSNSYRFSVIYSDNALVAGGTIDDKDLQVSGPNNFSQVAKLISVNPTRDSASMTAIYSIDAPNGIWDAKSSGTYTVTVRSNQVSDSSGNYVPIGNLGNFQVSLVAPTANLNRTNTILGSTDYQFTVVYNDETGVKRNTIDSQDIRVTGPNNFSQFATLISVSSAQDGSPLTATYSITAPGGVWDAPDRGRYTIALQANQVSDRDGNFIVAGTLGTFLADESIYTGDFDGDGKVDILLRDLDSQKVSVFLMGGTTLKSQAFLPDTPPNYTIADTTDRNGDGKADLLWQDVANQKVVLWSMDGTTLTSQAVLPELPIVAPIVNPIDFNGDGKADLLVRDPNNQKVLISLMDGTTLISQAFLPDQASELRIVGTADFNGDGKTDILMQDVLNGMVAVWFINGTKVTDILALSTILA